MSEVAILKRQIERERAARFSAEQLLEEKSLQLFTANQKLASFNKELESEVQARTIELSKARDAALASAEAKDEFLANMSHEIRTPLNGIIGMLHAMRQTNLAPKQLNLLSTAISSSHILLQVINDILEFSKFESLGVSIENTNINLFELLSRVMSSFAVTAKDKGLELQLNLDSDVPHSVITDGFRLQQILFNLVSNAIKFTAEGQITLVCKRLGDTLLRFAVLDTGIGISDDKKQKIFAAFEQADTSITRDYGGTGLGLTICARIAEAMHTHMQIEDNHGGGSAFFFDLQVSNCKSDETQHTVNPQSQIIEPFIEIAGLSDFKVLVVDDNSINLEVAKELISMTGAQVDCCSNGEEAIARVQVNHFDLIFMDLQMPQMDGFTVTSAIRSLGGKFQILPIVAMTANAQPRDRQRSLDNGLDGHLSKPINIDELNELMHKYAQNSIKPGISISDQNVWDKFTHLRGIDLTDTGSRFRTNVDLYQNLLELFCNEYLELNYSIEQLKCKSPKEIENICHKIKGTAGNLGAIRLSNAAATIETKLKEFAAADISSYLPELIASLNEVLENKVNSKTTIVLEPQTHISKEIIIENLKELEQCLRQDLGKARDIVEQLKSVKTCSELEPTRLLVIKAFGEFRLNDIESILNTTFDQ